MKRKVVAAKMTALILAAGMTFGSVSFAAERKDAEAIKEENQATEAVSEGETEAAEASDSQKKTEYPVTITTYGSDGLELETTYEKAAIYAVNQRILNVCRIAGAALQRSNS